MNHIGHIMCWSQRGAGERIAPHIIAGQGSEKGVPGHAQPPLGLRYGQAAVIIAMGAVRVMEMSVDEIVDVVSVRNGLVATSGTVLVTGIMTRAGMIRGTGRGIGRAHLEHVFVDVVTMWLMQVAVVQVIHMVAVLDRDMSAAVAVNVGMAFMDLMFVRHDGMMTPFASSGLGGGLASPRILTGVRQCIENHFGHVGVGKGVVDVFARAPPHDDVLGAQDAQPLRDSGQALAACFRQFGHAGFPLREYRQHAQPRLVSQCAKQPSGAFESLVTDQPRPGRFGVGVIAIGGLHENT